MWWCVTLEAISKLMTSTKCEYVYIFWLAPADKWMSMSHLPWHDPWINHCVSDMRRWVHTAIVNSKISNICNLLWDKYLVLLATKSCECEFANINTVTCFGFGFVCTQIRIQYLQNFIANFFLPIRRCWWFGYENVIGFASQSSN